MDDFLLQFSKRTIENGEDEMELSLNKVESKSVSKRDASSMQSFNLSAKNKSQEKLGSFSLSGSNSSREKLNSINLGSQSHTQSLSWLKHEVSGTNLAELDNFSLTGRNSSREFIFRPSQNNTRVSNDCQGDINMSETVNLLSLPNEVLLKICNFLEGKTLRRLGIMNKLLNNCAVLEFYDRGMYKMEVLHDNFGAIKEFSFATSLQPTNFLCYFKRGVASYKESEEEDALRDLNMALSLNPVGPELHIIRSMKCQIEYNFKGAVMEASRAIELDPLNGAAYYLRGYNRFDLQDYQGSLMDLSYCLSLPYPYKSKVYNCRGWCFKIMGETDKAIADFTESGKLNVRYTKPFVNKAILLSTKKDKPESMEDEKYLTDYINRNSGENLASVYYTRAAVRQQWDRFDIAISDYMKSIELGYHSIHKAFVSIGWCFEKLLKYELAIENYNMALKFKPNYSIAIEHRAGAKCRTDSERSVEDCKLAIQTNPKNLSFAYRYLAAVMADNNDYTHAIKVLSDGLQVNPLDTELLINRAGYFTCQGQFGLAINDYSSCLRHRPDTLDAWKFRANARFALGDILGSISDYQCALRIDQEESSVINNCALALCAIGQFDRALEIFQLALTRENISDRVVINRNMQLIEEVLDRGVINPNLFNPEFLNDQVFEKDIEKRMKEVMIANLIDALKYRSGVLQKKDEKSFTKSSRVTERLKQGRHE